GVDDGRLAVLRIDRHFEQVEQVARTWYLRLRTPSAFSTDHAHMVRRIAHQALREMRSVIGCLRQVNVPYRVGVVLARAVGTVIDQVHRAVKSGDPGEDSCVGGGDIDGDRW